MRLMSYAYLRKLGQGPWDHPILYPLAIILSWIIASWHWISGKQFIPWDSIDAFFPQVAFIVSALRAGQSPVWNPLAFGGQPVLGDPQGLIFSPHVLTGLLSGPAFGLWIFDLTTLACALGGALCIYAYARQHGAREPTAALGAIVFMLAGVATSRLQHVPQIITYGMLPAFVLAFRCAVQHPSVKRAVVLGLVAALLGWNPNHLVFLAPFLLSPVLMFELCRAPRLGAATLTVLSGAVLAALLTAPTLSTIMETVSYSNRQVFTAADSAPASLPPFALLSIVIPGLFGTLPGSSGPWSPVDSTEGYLYVGVIALCTVILGMARSDRPPLVLRLTWFGGFAALLFAMGTRGPVFTILFETVPGFSLFRRPADGAYFFVFYCALAVALASVPGDGRRSWHRRLVLPAGVAIGLLALVPSLLAYTERLGRLSALGYAGSALAFRASCVLATGIALYLLVPRRRREVVLTFAAMILLTADLTTAGRFGFFSSRYQTSEMASMFRVLRRWPTTGGDSGEIMRHLNEASGRTWRTEVVGGDFSRLAPMALGFPLSQGYNPFKLQRYVDVFGGQNLGDEVKRFSMLAPSYDAEPYRWLGLRFVLLQAHILTHSLDFGAFGAQMITLRDAILASGGREIAGNGAYRLFELPSAYPRALLVADSSETGTAPVILGRCETLFEGTTRLSYRCRAAAPARLVIGDSFAPGWHACVNGTPRDVEPFAHALRSIGIPGGDAQVELTYHAVPFLRRFASCGGS